MEQSTSSHKGKRAIESKTNKKIIIAIIIVVILILLFVLGWFFLGKQKNEEVPTNSEETQNVVETNETENEAKKDEDEIVDVSHLPEKMGAYPVIGELVIDKIEVKQNILDRTEDASLNLAVTHFYGPKVNEVGNLCLTGHNYKNLLKRLSEVEVGDTFYLISKDNKTKVNYEIYDIYTCNPNQVQCLEQPTEEVREVTLITCNPRRGYKAYC